MRRQGLSGEIVQLFHSQSTGIIHGDDGYDAAFSEESLVVGLGYRELGLGLRVSYGIFSRRDRRFLPPSTCSLRPALEPRQRKTRKMQFSTRVGGFSVV